MSTVRELFAMLREDVEKEAIEETKKHHYNTFEGIMNEVAQRASGKG